MRPLLLALLALASGLDAAPPQADPWLRVEVLARGSDSVRLRLTNLTQHPLHAAGSRSWGMANFVKVGFEVLPFTSRTPAGRWEEGRPDLDMGFGNVQWTELDETLRQDLPAKAPLELDVSLPPPSARGNVDLIVVARRGPRWLTYRETVGRRLFLPGDARAAALRASLAALLALLAVRSRRRSREAVTLRSALAHSLAVLAIAGVALSYLHRLHYRELPYTDGAAYAVLARSHMEGRGLVSPVILPALMKLVPTSERGQAFVTQAPLWPLLLSHVFDGFGATPLAVAMTGYVLGALTTLGVWWIAVLVSRRAWCGYLAAGLLLTNPEYYSSIANGSTIPLQAFLVCGLVLLMWSPLRPWSAAAAGALAGIGIVARENTIFVAAGLAACWLPQLRDLLRPPRRREAAATLLPALVLALIPIALESSRKSQALGRSGHPTLHATMFYGTPVLAKNWYWHYEPAGLGVDPVEYFAANPKALWTKVRHHVGDVFLGQTLPALLSTSPWYVPIVLPWLFADRRSARAAWCVLLAILLQVAGASVSFLFPTYFLIFVPPLCALVAATVHALVERWFQSTGVFRKAVIAATAAYALAPLAVNLGAVSTSGAVWMGDYSYAPQAVKDLAAFVRANTPEDAVIAFGHVPAPLLAWETHRTIVSYDPAPGLRPSNSDMWRRIDAQLPLDFILLSSMTDADTEHVLEGFQLVASTETRWLKAWLFRRAAPG